MKDKCVKYENNNIGLLSETRSKSLNIPSGNPYVDVLKTLVENPDAIRATSELVDKLGDNLNPLKMGTTIIMKHMDLETEREKRRQIEALTNPEFVRAVTKYKNIDKCLQEGYRERTEGLDILYKQLESKDKDVVIQAMITISNIISSSPLEELEKVENIHRDPTQPLLDF